MMDTAEALAGWMREAYQALEKVENDWRTAPWNDRDLDQILDEVQQARFILADALNDYDPSFKLPTIDEEGKIQ